MGPLDFEAITPGQTLLVAGPGLTDKRRLVLEILARRAEEAAGFVTTRKSGETIQQEFGSLVDLDAWDFRIIDCVSSGRSRRWGDGPADMESVSSAGDLTGIGIKLAGFLQAFYHNESIDVAGIGLHSLSTMLMYVDVRRVYQFVHVMTRRISSSGFIGAFALDTVPGDMMGLTRLQGLFDTLVEVREEPERSLRVRGAKIGPREWTAF